MNADLGRLTAEDLAAWLATLREASGANPDEAAARAYEIEAHRVELEMQNRELRRTQAALIESHARYRDLYDLAPIAYLTVGRDGQIQEANQTAATLLGSDRVRLIGRSLVSHVSPHDRDLWRRHLARCLEERVQINSEIRLTSRGRDEVITHVISVPIASAAGEVLGCRTTLADISLIKRGEARIALLARASLLLAAPLVDDVPCDELLRLLVPDFADLAALDLVDDEGRLRPVALAGVTAGLERRAAAASPSGRWTEAGIPEPLASGEPVFVDPCSPELLAERGLEDEPLLRTCGATSALLVPVRSRSIYFGVLTLAATDKRRRFADPDRTIVQDLAARLASALHNARLYREARDAIKAREEVLTFVAHDLRNPVNAIFLNLASVLDVGPTEERRRGWHRLNQVRRTAEQMNRMIDDLLDLSNVDAGELNLEAVDCDVLDVLQDARDALGPLAEQKGIELQVSSSAAAERVRCDPARMLQVFSNIVGNAVKFTASGGFITLSARASGEQVVFSIADSGEGVAPADLERLFERYWRADQHAHKGRGLGLYIARRIVEAHGGRIWADSDPDLGTTLHFTLPRADAPARAPAETTTDGRTAESARSNPAADEAQRRPRGAVASRS